MKARILRLKGAGGVFWSEAVLFRVSIMKFYPEKSNNQKKQNDPMRHEKKALSFPRSSGKNGESFSILNSFSGEKDHKVADNGG